VGDLDALSAAQAGELRAVRELLEARERQASAETALVNARNGTHEALKVYAEALQAVRVATKSLGLDVALQPRPHADGSVPSRSEAR
jgi:preprotein translocase subunit SecA